MLNSILKILSNECPRCDNGKVFRDKSFYFSFGFPKMNTHCPNCSYKFEREPGFFIGAMYISYALTIGESIITYLIAQQFFEKLFDVRIVFVVLPVLLLLMFVNIRISRMVWMYLFKKSA